MILPSKHLAPERALLTIGASVLNDLGEPKTVSRLWADMRATRPAERYDWFVLALDLLFILGAVDHDHGRLRRRSR
jgi:hypothetical protein